jgi:hypothetical protein
MKTILTLLLLGLSTTAFSQTYFSARYYFEPYNIWDVADNVIENDSNYVVVGGTGDINNFSWHRLGFLTIDKYGNKVSSKSFGDTISEYYIQFDGAFRKNGENEYSGVGVKREYTLNGMHDAGIIYRFNQLLDTIWTNSRITDRVLPIDTSYVFNHFDILPNKDLIIAGYIIIDGETAKALLLKTDSLGNEQWRKYFYSGSLNRGINVIHTPDGGFALSCYKWTFGLYAEATPYIVKTDSVGNEQWRYYVPYTAQKHGYMYLQNSPDSTIIGGYSYSDYIDYPATDNDTRDAVLKIDLEKNIIWDRKYGEYSWNKAVNSVNIDNDGNIILAGNKPELYPPLRQGFLFKINNNGDSIWYRQYHKLQGDYSYSYLYGVTPTSDGGFIAVGDVLPSPPDTGNQDVWVIKVDSMGCENWDECWVGVKENIALREAEELLIYPNPTSNLVNIFIAKENENENHELLIFDLFGRKVKETKVPLGTTTIQIDIARWKSGLYTAISSYKGKVTGRGKFVVR